MAPTSIMKCPNCNGLFLAGTLQKTKTCPYCGKGLNLQKTLCVAQAASPVEASEILKQLKAKVAQNPCSKYRV